MFTCFLLGSEWSQYSLQRKGLRVSGTPTGAQRSTYFLQLPYRFSLPLLILSGVMHWLLSQSIYVVHIKETAFFPDASGAYEDLGEILTCGYSPSAILGVILISIAMMAAALVTGRRRFKGYVPVAATCSASISAMCHVMATEDGQKAVSRPIKWGVVEKGRVGHCSFSSSDVEVPESGKLYY